MTSQETPDVFDLPGHLAEKAAPELVADDKEHFALIASVLRDSILELSDRLDEARRTSLRSGQEALDRDFEVHRLTGRLRLLRRYGLDLCLGRMVEAGTGQRVYVGRLGLVDRAGTRLLVDWRSPAAEPFFAATHGNPAGLASRRRYRWRQGRIADYWDEVFSTDDLGAHAALDDQSAFIASLGSSRSPRMRDVLTTIAADQDAIIRAGSRGALVVDGGPGTGKTVVALHRAAYLLYADPRLGAGKGGVLFVGPHQPYLSYVADVLPSLGEEGVQTCTLRDLVPEGITASEESDPLVARLKASAAMVQAIEPAVRLYEEPPDQGIEVETMWADVWLSAADWAEAFSAPDPGTPHNEARDMAWEALLDILVDKTDGEGAEVVAASQLRQAFARNDSLNDAFGRAWPLIDPVDLVGDLWSVPAYLRMCAPWLDETEVRALQRPDPHAWTLSDLPLLDAARQRLGDPDSSRLRRHRQAAVEAERERMSRVIDDLIETDDSEMLVMSMLRVEDAQSIIVDEDTLPSTTPDRLAGPFAHVVIDEAQEVSDAEWQMLIRRCPSRSFTVVGDRAQARQGFAETWRERLQRVGMRDVSIAALNVNYRTPAEVMEEAEPVIRAALPDANVPTSIRHSGLPVVHGSASDLDQIIDQWLAEHHEGIVCLIGAPGHPRHADRVRALPPAMTKGLEFDLVILVDPEHLGSGTQGAVDRYVAMTRATQQLVILTST